MPQLTLLRDRLYRKSVPTLSIELPPRQAIAEANLRRWRELLSDPKLARLDERVETDRFGHIIMSPPASAEHGSYQFRIGALLEQHMSQGRVITECPISTADGVKAADVAWASAECLQELASKACFLRAPEICIEVISPGNTQAEISEKSALYFDAGAKEVWHCDSAGVMTFWESARDHLARSRMCPDFPPKVELR
jgi:Uma2 family endonuclease